VHLMIDNNAIRREGYTVLRGAIPREWRDELRETFDSSVLPSHEWPVPRGADWQHALVDLNPRIQQVCRLPTVLAAAGALIQERFFLAQVEGREPRAGGGHQVLHRDMHAQRPGDTVNALAFFDNYGPHNGATRLVPQSHRYARQQHATTDIHEDKAQQLLGEAGDIVVFDADLLHGACLNPGGARRRSLLFTYFADALYAVHMKTAHLRNVRMDTSERFYPLTELTQNAHLARSK
jgi:hypothetical protein